MLLGLVAEPTLTGEYCFLGWEMVEGVGLCQTWDLAAGLSTVLGPVIAQRRRSERRACESITFLFGTS